VSLEAGLEKMERFLQDAEAVIAAAEPPPFIQDPAECRRCPFMGGACTPPLDYGEGAAIITDPEVIADTEREAELAEAAREYSRLHEKAKQRFQDVKEFAIVGNCLVRVTRRKKTWLELPDDVKAKLTKSDPEGATVVKVERMEGA
jgi:hypothetical protein